jgi:hypothetical protein
MKKKNIKKAEYLPSVILYRDDLEEIFNIMNSLELYQDILDANSRDIIKKKIKPKISDNENEYETFDEMQNINGDTINELTIRNNTRISLSVDNSFDNNSMFLSAVYPTDDITTEGAYLKIKDLLLNRRRIISYIFNYYLSTIYIIILWYLFYYCFANLIFHNRLLVTTTVLIIAILTGVILYLSFFLTRGAFSTIYLIKRKEQSSFWKRNKDDLIKIVITIVLTALITIPTTCYFAKDTSKTDNQTNISKPATQP